MVLILEGNSEIGANVYSEIGNLVCLQYFLDRQQSNILNLYEKGMIIHLRYKI